jgi:hypothetical protein
MLKKLRKKFGKNMRKGIKNNIMLKKIIQNITGIGKM